MKRHIATSAQRIDGRDEGRPVADVADRPPSAFDGDAGTQPASSPPKLALARVTARMHTLVLTGELNHRSAHALEAEIERVCEDGVSGITLDLSELTYIDPIGVAVIAFRCGFLTRRGYDVAVIPGSRLIHRAFEEAGVADLLSVPDNDVAAPRPSGLVLEHRPRDACAQ